MNCGITFIQLETLASILERLFSKDHQHLNLTSLSAALGASQEEIDVLLDFIFRFQELMTRSQFNNRLVKVRKSGKWYLTVAKDHQDSARSEIQLTKSESKLVSDIIHYFLHIAKGVGFNLRFSASELSKNVKDLKKAHPYFFETRGNGLVYPTSLALSIGTQLESYNRTNRSISCLMCENYKIIIT